MSGSEGSFSKARLEAFSDGVMAIIITIMVLDLKAPRSAEPSELVKLWPSFIIYLVSFFLLISLSDTPPFTEATRRWLDLARRHPPLPLPSRLLESPGLGARFETRGRSRAAGGS